MDDAQPSTAPITTASTVVCKPVRTCVGCRRARPQSELARLARTPDGVRYDSHQQLPGRGAYVCPHPNCIEAAAARGAQVLRRALRGTSEGEVRAALDAVRTAQQRGEIPPENRPLKRDQVPSRRREE